MHADVRFPGRRAGLPRLRARPTQHLLRAVGAPLAQALAARHPGQIWETTHVGGHRFAANLVILPHGLYYGPVGLDAATAAIGAYQRGAVAPGRYRGRAGQPKPVQEAEHALLTGPGPCRSRYWVTGLAMLKAVNVLESGTRGRLLFLG